MKWWEFSDDCGDGTSIMRRFRTKEEAEEARAFLENSPYFQQDGDGSPIHEIDTESSWFFDTIEDIKAQHDV